MILSVAKTAGTDAKISNDPPIYIEFSKENEN